MNVAPATPQDAPAMASVHAQAFDKPWDESNFEDLLDGEGIFGVLAQGADPAGVLICRAVAGEAEILTVGVFRDEHPERVIDTIGRAGLKAAQLHGHETPGMVREVAASVRWVIKAVVAGSPDALHANEFGTDLILVDAPSPGSGQVFDWGLFEGLPDGPRYILAGGLHPGNVANAVERVMPWGVDVASGVEKTPGRKDALKVKSFVERARAAAPAPHLGPDDLPYDWADEL